MYSYVYYIYICIHVYMTYVLVYIYIYIYMCVCVYMYMWYISIYIYIYLIYVIYIYIYICIYVMITQLENLLSRIFSQLLGEMILQVVFQGSGFVLRVPRLCLPKLIFNGRIHGILGVLFGQTHGRRVLQICMNRHVWTDGWSDG